MSVAPKARAPRNRTLVLEVAEQARYEAALLTLTGPCVAAAVENRTLCQDSLSALDWLPTQSFDLVFADPPYNLNKAFNQQRFNKQPLADYEAWLEGWVSRLPRLLKPTGAVYVCGDWESSAALQSVLARHFILRNRITWEREKGRGASHNWKNCAEDIWWATCTDDYVFNLEAVKLKRQVRAPYLHDDGQPKDWQSAEAGRFRLTAPSNLWTDLTVPFWSMRENTDHPTQKPEKLLAKILLASTLPGAWVLDPFLGSGTTSVVAKKLGRRYLGIEQDRHYCCLAEKRLALAALDPRIQGYEDGCFWERNSRPLRPKSQE